MCGISQQGDTKEPDYKAYKFVIWALYGGNLVVWDNYIPTSWTCKGNQKATSYLVSIDKRSVIGDHE